MNAKEANKISINEYLKYRGFYPAKRYGPSYFYYSPFRSENTPSFKVCNLKNLWVDYGDSNSDGRLIDLVLRFHPGYGVSEAIQAIANMPDTSFSFHQQSVYPYSTEGGPIPETGNKIRIHRIKELGNNLALTDYLMSRKIPIPTARHYCKELYFHVGEKHYFGLGNRTNMVGRSETSTGRAVPPKAFPIGNMEMNMYW